MSNFFGKNFYKRPKKIQKLKTSFKNFSEKKLFASNFYVDPDYDFDSFKSEHDIVKLKKYKILRRYNML